MKKTVFVIMPFVQANNRDQDELTKFFTDHIKDPIENSRDLDGKYVVNRSSDDFLILDNILLDLANADLVICDLSGVTANANVIFELGIRLSVSHKPVILIRENLDSNKSMFDVHGLHAFHYKMSSTKDLERFLIKKISEYDDDSSKYSSPVLKILNHEAAFWMQLPIRKASAFLGGISSAADANLRAFTKAINIFLRKNEVHDFLVDDPATVYKPIESLSENVKALNCLESFSYNISSIPSLDSYLSSVYLLGLIEESIERKFRTYAMHYSLHFNKGNSGFFWDRRFDEIHAYAKETLILMNLCRTTIKILRSKQGSEERNEYIKSFDGIINSSEFENM
ncbi:hypothetical protein P9875_08045 [Janthinobacterium rivuli]|uniref:Nucleoside 2-deoxyribosyltransferase n=1 Tax=Janthinobacterium rivuli TaxID=2751478 RepID=A0ABY8I861_9BURK|nr:hypothetical protein [Janthinobacterium rivuli]WFR81107.1 hypothetical protein P9875_08045 [Janthinobacterium rivuli]